MAEPFRIQRESDGAVWEYDSPFKVPPGFREMEQAGPLAPQATPQPAPMAKPELPAWASPTLGGILPFETRVNRPQMELGASLLVPGGTVARSLLLGKALGQAAVSGGSSLMHGEGPLEAGKKAVLSGGATSVGGGLAKGTAKVLSPLTSGLALKEYTSDIAKKVATELQKRVPWFSGFKADNTGLTEMLYGPKGWNALHEGYDQSLKEVIKRGTGTMLTLLPEEAQKLGLKAAASTTNDPRVAQLLKQGFSPNDPQIQKMFPGVGQVTTQMEGVPVDAGKLAKAITGKWKRGEEWAALYRKVVDMLDDEGIGDPASRAAYKTVMGLRDYLHKTKGIGEGGLDLLKAQSGLRNKASDVLNRRGLGDFYDMLRGNQMISKGKFNVPGAALGGILGGTLGGGMIPGYGHVGGIAGGSLAGGRIPFYRGAPPAGIEAIGQELMTRLSGPLAAQNRQQVPLPE